MNTAELTAAHADTLALMAIARTLSNIERRAANLWADGYSVKDAPETGCYYVTTPARRGDVNGSTKKTYKVRCSDIVGYRCTCPAFGEFDSCKHLIAVRNMIEEGERADAQWEIEEECRNFFNGRFDR